MEQYYCSIHSLADDKVNICIYNATGKVMHEQIQNLLQGANTVELSMATLSAGVYYVKFMVDGESWYKKMIKE